MSRKKLFLTGMVIVTILLGFYRDHLFVSINKSIETGMDVDGRLSVLKWVLTLVFSLLYLLITGVFLRIIFNNRKYVVIAVLIYGVLVAVSLLAAAVGSITSSFENIYPFIRTVMGIAQSPIIAMVLIPAFLINNARKQ